MDNMKNGIPCNDYLHTPKAKKNRIVFKFVNDDGNTPSSCTVQLGDIDPMTGAAITDMSFFTEYYKMVDHEVYIQGKETKNRLSLDGLTFDDGDDECERKHHYSTPAVDPFEDDESKDIHRLREATSSLTGRLADVYEAMLVQYSGGTERISMREIAAKWHVHVSQVYKDQEKIVRMIKKSFESSRNAE